MITSNSMQMSITTRLANFLIPICLSGTPPAPPAANPLNNVDNGMTIGAQMGINRGSGGLIAYGARAMQAWFRRNHGSHGRA